MMGWELEIGKIVVSTIIGYFIGNRNAAVKEKRERVNISVNEIIQLVRKTSNEAIEYYTSDMDLRERNGSCANILSNLKRLSGDLVRLAKCAKKEETFFSKEKMHYHNAVSSEPFGEEVIITVKHDNHRIKIIQDSENFLIQRLNTLVDE